jgi:cysteine desulfurase
MSIYLDYNATTPLDPEVLTAMQPSLSGPPANASSLHRFGRIARDAVEQARAEVAALVGARPGELTFTSGATESNNLALKGTMAAAVPGARLLYGSTEHPSVLEAAEALGRAGYAVEPIAMTRSGLVDWPRFQAQLDRAPVALVALMLANNETGVIADIARAAACVHARDGLLLVDAVQAAGKIEVDFDALGADLLSLSAHKIYGPKGIGALLVRAGIEVEPLLHGGGQEHGRRGGTENVPAIIGFGAAAELARRELPMRCARMRALRDRFEAGLADLPGAQIFGAGPARLPNTVQFVIPGWEGEALLMALDRRGIGVSSGSACASGRGEPSHVLLAMGIERDLAYGAVRVSLGKDSSESDVDRMLAALGALHPMSSAA